MSMTCSSSLPLRNLRSGIQLLFRASLSMISPHSGQRTRDWSKIAPHNAHLLVTSAKGTPRSTDRHRTCNSGSAQGLDFVQPPRREELKNWSFGEVLKIGEFLVVLDEDAVPSTRWEERGMKPIGAYVFYDDFYYIITARKGETTREDLVRIVENMKPVGRETLRKS